MGRDPMTKLTLVRVLTCSVSVVLLLSIVGFFLAGDKQSKAVRDHIAELKSPKPGVRHRGAKALAEIGPASKVAVPDLIPLLKDDDPRARAHAARPLGRMRAPPKEAIP